MVTVLSVGAVVVAVYYMLVWLKLRSDSSDGGTVSSDELPGELSAAGMRFVCRKAFDNKCGAVAIVDLAVRGHVQINKSDGMFELASISSPDKEVPVEERRLAETLFDDRRQIVLDSQHHRTVSAATREMAGSLKSEYEGRYFRTNTRCFIIGLVLSTLFFLAAGVSATARPGGAAVLLLTICLPAWMLGIFLALRECVVNWPFAGFGGATRGHKIALLIMISVLSLGLWVILVALTYQTSLLFLPVFVAIATLNLLFWRLLRMPTREGRDLMKAIKSFRQSIVAGHGGPPGQLATSEMTSELFDRYLPYAMALNAGRKWGQRLAGPAHSLQGYRPAWYQGPRLDASDDIDFASKLGRALTEGLLASLTNRPPTGVCTEPTP